MSPVERVEKSRHAARRANGRLRAFTVFSEEVYGADVALPLNGVAVAVKDLYDTAGLETAYGSPIYRGHRPKRDAWLVERLKALGAFVIGKTETTEFAWRQPAPTVNPWNVAHTPGGSSSGSAAAVAAGLVPLALGTQTYGSIIRPAAFCGVAGFKPTHGVISLEGVHPLSPTLDHAGYLAPSVLDLARVHALVSNTMINAEDVRPPERLRLVRSDYWSRASEGQKHAIMRAVAALREAGVEVTETELPEDFATAPELANIILCFEAAGIYAPLIDGWPHLVSAHIKDLVARGKSVERATYEEARAAARRLAEKLETEMAQFDAILTLPALGEARLLSEGTGDPGPCILWTLLGVPAATMRCGFGKSGLPLGIQLIGRSGQDLRHLDLCSRIEAVPGLNDGSHRRDEAIRPYIR